MHKRLVFSACFLGVMLATVPAFALLVPNKSVRDIELRMTPAEVTEAAGEPRRERVVAHEIVGRQRVMVYGKRRDEKTKVYFSGTRPKSEVIALVTTDVGERTHDDVGIGSTKPDVRRALRREKCKQEFGTDHCFKGRYRPGKRVTDFIFNRHDMVKRIVVGIVID